MVRWARLWSELKSRGWVGKSGGGSPGRGVGESKKEKVGQPGYKIVASCSCLPSVVPASLWLSKTLSLSLAPSRCLLAGSVGTRPLALPVSGAVLASWPIPTEGGGWGKSRRRRRGCKYISLKYQLPIQPPPKENQVKKEEPLFDRWRVCVCVRARTLLFARLRVDTQTHALSHMRVFGHTARARLLAGDERQTLYICSRPTRRVQDTLHTPGAFPFRKKRRAPALRWRLPRRARASYLCSGAREGVVL